MVHICQFYNCQQVSLAYELAYIIEIGKYCHERGHSVSLDGVTLDAVLEKSRYWGYLGVAVKRGWVSGVPEMTHGEASSGVLNVLLTEERVSMSAGEAHRRKVDKAYDFETPKLAQVAFEEKSDDCWVWNTEYSQLVNYGTFKVSNGETVLLSLLAYVAVNRAFEGYPRRLLLDIGWGYASNYMLMAGFLALYERTQILNGWVYYAYADDVTLEVANKSGYASWWSVGYEMGWGRRPYSGAEKKAYADRLGVSVGDILFLYDVDATKTAYFVSDILGFHFVRVDAIDEAGVTLTAFHTKKTRYQGVVDWESKTTDLKQMYGWRNPDAEMNSETRKYSWDEVGCEYCYFGEEHFIKLCERGDGKVVWVQEGDWSPVRVNLDAIDLIYWILKDYGVKFNEQRYKAQYFGGEESLYERYVRTGLLPREVVCEG